MRRKLLGYVESRQQAQTRHVAERSILIGQEAQHKKSILPVIRQEARHVAKRSILIGQGAQQVMRKRAQVWHKECTSTVRKTRSGPLVVETAQ